MQLLASASAPFARGPGGFSQPEVLPPVAPDGPARPHEYSWQVSPPPPPPPQQGPQPPVRRRAGVPVTYGLVGINVLVFVMMVSSGVSPTNPSTAELLRWGAMDGDLVAGAGQWYRLLTSAFVHVGIIHLACNMWCLWNLGLLAEPLLGSMGMLAVYVLSGIAGNVLGMAVHPHSPGAGASGAVFGIAGVLILLLGVAALPIPPMELKRLRRSVIYFAGLNFALGLFADFAQSAIQIDNMAHLGGFLSGLAVGFPLAPRVMAGRVRYLRRQAITFGAAAVLLAAITFGVYQYLTS